MRLRTGSSGFTLLEVLVATAIMAIAVTGLLTTMTTSLRNASRVTDTDRAVLLARQKIDELLVTPVLPKNAPMAGQWSPALTGGTLAGWTAIVTDYERPPAAGPGTPLLERVALEVWCESNGKRQTFHLDGYRSGKIPPPATP